MSTPLTPVTAANVDLSNCDRELIQYSGAVQPHGALITLSEPDLTILQVSANTGGLLGLVPARLLGRTLSELFGTSQTEQVRQRLLREVLENVPAVHVLRAVIGLGQFHVFAHRSDGVLVLELEVAGAEQPVMDLYSEVRSTIGRLQNTTSLQDFFNLAVKEIRHLTGYDRVMAYKFLPDGSGEVTSEAIADGLEPYLGLRYPASDIPQPARRMFTLAWLRHLPDVDYKAVPLTPALNPATNGPLDLSYVAGRSVSVMYSKYLQNMGVKSTMVMTLLKNGALWGLVSCMHHQVPRHIPFEVRMACEFLTHMVSLLMAAKEDTEVYEYKLKLNAVMERLIEHSVRGGSVYRVLVDKRPNLLSLIRAEGAAVVSNEGVTATGTTPAETDLQELANWLARQPDSVFATDNLSQVYPAAAPFANTASGLLAARLSRSGSDFMMWFRPEIIETVKWAGDPKKPVEIETMNQETRLRPRTSFALWKEEVRGRSVPWLDFEIDAVCGLRQALIEIVVDRAEELARLNRELAQSNVELDSFAYVASHDLKEPLRGIHNYTKLLQKSANDRLSEGEQSRLETVLKLTLRMDDLIESLLQYSRVGRIDMALRPVDLNEIVQEALDLLRPRIEESGATISVSELPTVTCDRIRIREVFYNLILNAMKYNERTEKRVEIGFLETSGMFYVRDNGIGIDAEHFEDVFKIFKRLHGREEYGGGNGAGLTIARRVVERHGGRMWVESTPWVGSKFCFTLQAAQPASSEVQL